MMKINKELVKEFKLGFMWGAAFMTGIELTELSYKQLKKIPEAIAKRKEAKEVVEDEILNEEDIEIIGEE